MVHMTAADGHLVNLARACRAIEAAKAQGAHNAVLAMLRAGGRYHLTCWSTLRKPVH